MGFIIPDNIAPAAASFDALYEELLEASGYAVRSLHSAAPVWIIS